MTIDSGTRLNHYEIISRIGAGGMGEVYLAQDTKLDRRVALKLLPEEFAGDTERMRRFVQEAKSASALNHPNIITIHEVGDTDGAHFIATEYVEGETLSRRLRSEPMSLKSTLEIAIQIASALQAAHAAGIVHRDIKPDNVIGEDGTTRRSDQAARPVETGIPTSLCSELLFCNSSYRAWRERRGLRVAGKGYR